jgi:hypothetical protein
VSDLERTDTPARSNRRESRTAPSAHHLCRFRLESARPQCAHAHFWASRRPYLRTHIDVTTSVCVVHQISRVPAPTIRRRRPGPAWTSSTDERASRFRSFTTNTVAGGSDITHANSVIRSHEVNTAASNRIVPKPQSANGHWHPISTQPLNTPRMQTHRPTSRHPAQHTFTHKRDIHARIRTNVSANISHPKPRSVAP